MKSTQEKIQEIRANGYGLDFGIVFNTAFECWKKMALMSGLALLVFGIVFAALALGVVTLLGGFEAYTGFLTGIANDSASILSIAIYFISMCVIAGLTNPFTAGILMMAKQADLGEEVSVGDAFQCYRPPYFVPLFVEAFIVSIFTVSLTTFIQMAMPATLLTSAFTTLLNIVITFLTCMAVPLIVFGNLGPVEAIRSSVAVTTRNVFVLLLLLFVAYAFGIAGFIVFCLGSLFTIPFVYCTYYAIYKHSVGIAEESEIDQIGLEDIY